jgi:hypothetical protein
MCLSCASISLACRPTAANAGTADITVIRASPKLQNYVCYSCAESATLVGTKICCNSMILPIPIRPDRRGTHSEGTKNPTSPDFLNEMNVKAPCLLQPLANYTQRTAQASGLCPLGTIFTGYGVISRVIARFLPASALGTRLSFLCYSDAGIDVNLGLEETRENISHTWQAAMCMVATGASLVLSQLGSEILLWQLGLSCYM